MVPSVNKNTFIPESVLLREDATLEAQGIVDKTNYIPIGPKHVIASQTDWAFFSLAPVYMLVKIDGKPLIDFDLVEQFKADQLVPKDFECLRYMYSDKLFTGLSSNTPDKYVLHCVPIEVFEEFKTWLNAQAFTYTTDNKAVVWKVKSGQYYILDPIDNKSMASITFFLPETNNLKVYVSVIQDKPHLTVVRK